MVVDEEVVGVITARNRAGAAVGHGGHDMTAQLVVQGVAGAPGPAAGAAAAEAGQCGAGPDAGCRVEDRGDGTYGVRVRAAVAGDYALVGACRGAGLGAGLRLAVRPRGPLVWGSQGKGQGQFTNPYGIAVGPDGSVYVADYNNHRVQVFRSDGSFVRVMGSQGTDPGQFSGPTGVCVGANGMVFVTDIGNQRVQGLAL